MRKRPDLSTEGIRQRLAAAEGEAQVERVIAAKLKHATQMQAAMTAMPRSPLALWPPRKCC